MVAGTDVLATDKLGGFRLTLAECVLRNELVLKRLTELSVPVVFLGGGGYSKESAVAIARSISNLYRM